MPEPFKPIRFSGHAREQMAHRGASEEDVREAILEGKWGDADRGRRDSRKDFAFNAEWNGRHYRNQTSTPGVC